MKIDQLPLEILMHILSYLTGYAEVLLVNKLFYSVACKLQDPNICLTIDESFFCGQWMSDMSFILRTTRQISRLNIYTLGRNETELRAVISIIKKFSVSLKCFKLKTFSVVNMAEFLGILSLISSVEHLICENIRLRGENQPSNFDDLNLRLLKKLRFKCCFNELSMVFNRLPAGVVEELDLHDFDFNTITNLLKRQMNIKKLKLTACDSDYVSSDIFNNVTLEALELWYRPSDNFDLATILSKQTKLRSLKLRLVEIDKNLIDFVTNQLTELEIFSMDGPFSMPTDASIAQIIQLTKLRKVSLLFKFTNELGLIKSLSESVNPKITTLTLGYGIYEFDVIQALARSVPNLRILNLDCYVYSMEAEGFMRMFNFVEVLEIRRVVVYDTEEFTEGDYFNPKLKKLIVNGDFVNATRFLNKLIASYPNLKKLELKWKSITNWQLLEILGGFTRLESLKLDGGISFDLTKHFFSYIKNYKKHLKFIALNGINVIER